MNEHPKKANWFKRHKFLTVLLAVILIGLISSAANGSSPEPKPAKPTPAATAPKWDAAAVYDKVAVGMTKPQVEQVTGKSGKNCTESAIQGYGSTESCSYGGDFGDHGSILVIYANGSVQSKSKMSF